MRLITHNILKCNKKGVKNGFPLKIEVSQGGAAHIVSRLAQSVCRHVATKL